VIRGLWTTFGPVFPLFSGFLEPEAWKTAQKPHCFVVQMQQCGKRTPGNIQTPKKAAIARVFRFTFPPTFRTLSPRISFVQSINACHFGPSAIALDF
jgi:hypothetical protein